MRQPFPGLISSLVAQPKTRRHLGPRVNIFIQDRFSFALSAHLVFKYGLKPEMEIDPPFLSRLLQEDGDVRAYVTAINFIGYRPRASEEIKKRLQRDEWPLEVIERVVERLANEKLLDDAEFASMWVGSRSRNKPRGGRLLQQELRQKGVAKAEIEAALPPPDEETANAVAALAKQWRKIENLEARTRKQKAIEFLQRRGFGYGTAKAALGQVEEDEAE